MNSINGNAENNMFYVDALEGQANLFLRSCGSLALAAASFRCFAFNW